MKCILFLLFSISCALADNQQRLLAGFDPRTDLISPKYEAGQFLIYDCEDKHWVCVSELAYNECVNKRNKDHEDTENSRHSCANIGKFPTKMSCFQRQSYLTTHHHGVRFCLKENSY